MSFARLALRLATVKALAGVTIAGDRVRDSEIGQIEDIAENEAAPVIIVYTDDEEVDISRRDLSSHDGLQALVIQIAVTTRMKGGEAPLPPLLTSEGIEMTLDLIERQVLATLTGGQSAWAKVWRQLTPEIKKRRSRRGASAQDGVRFAGREIEISVKLPKEPNSDSVSGPVWADFFAAVADDADLAPVSASLQAIAVGDAALDVWLALRAAYGISEREAQALLIEPTPENFGAPAIADAPVDVDQVGEGHDVVLPEDLP